MSFGDIQTGTYRTDKIGVNSVITKNHKFDDLLIQAKNEGKITLDCIEPSIVNKSQKTMLNHKRKLAWLNMHIETMIGNQVPLYDIKISNDFSIKDFFLYLSIKIQRQIGKNRSLWFIIDLINKLMK